MYLLVSCYGVRYARIDAGANYLQMSQLAVYNTSGSNVAKGKSTTASPVYSLATCTYYASAGVDGVLVAKTFTNCAYKTYVSADVTGDYWQVDLGSEQTINKVVYYNRADSSSYTRALTYTLTLLNTANQSVCTTGTFTSSLIQDLTLIAGIPFYLRVLRFTRFYSCNEDHAETNLLYLVLSKSFI